MAKEHDRTKQCRRRKWFYAFLHFLCLFGPFLFFIPQAFIIGTVVTKIAFSLCAAVGLIIGALGLLAEATHRAGYHKSVGCALLLGLTFALPQLQPLIIAYSVSSILDELIFARRYDHYKDLLKTNKEIDRRA